MDHIIPKSFFFNFQKLVSMIMTNNEKSKSQTQEENYIKINKYYDPKKLANKFQENIKE